jgi:hypothetical protein
VNGRTQRDRKNWIARPESDPSSFDRCNYEQETTMEPFITRLRASRERYLRELEEIANNSRRYWAENSAEYEDLVHLALPGHFVRV